MLSIVVLSVIMLSVIMLSVIRLSVIMLRVIVLSVIMLSVIMLSVVAPKIFMTSAFDYNFNPARPLHTHIRNKKKEKHFWCQRRRNTFFRHRRNGEIS